VKVWTGFIWVKTGNRMGGEILANTITNLPVPKKGGVFFDQKRD
jgi:hypothetical protein